MEEYIYNTVLFLEKLASENKWEHYGTIRRSLLVICKELREELKLTSYEEEDELILNLENQDVNYVELPFSASEVLD